MKTLKKELASIGRQYAGRDGAIDYYHAGEFSEAIADHIQRQTETLLARNEPLLAFQAGMDALREYSGYGIDGSNGEYGLVMEAMEGMCVDVLTAADEIVAEKIFDLLADCAKSDQEDWFVQEFAEQMLFSRFTGKHYDEKKLALTDEQIAALTSSGKKDHFSEYKIEQMLMRRFGLMKKLSRPKEEQDSFLERYTNYSDIRKLRVRQALDEGKTDEAIRLLEEGKSADRDKRGLVAGYSEWLMDLYEQRGRRDKLIAELEYYVFVLSSGGMEMLNRLKQACTPAQWIEYRERYLSGRNYHRLELMESEELWERLMRAAVKSENLSTLDRYESALNSRYPNEMLEAYACILTQEAAVASDRKRYQELARYLKKLKSYPGGAERAAQLAESSDIQGKTLYSQCFPRLCTNLDGFWRISGPVAAQRIRQILAICENSSQTVVRTAKALSGRPVQLVYPVNEFLQILNIGVGGNLRVDFRRIRDHDLHALRPQGLQRPRQTPDLVSDGVSCPRIDAPADSCRQACVSDLEMK